MDILLAGSGSADGWPNPFCACASCTTERGAGRLRSQTSALVDGALLLDCGPQTPQSVAQAGLDLTGLRHVLITHQHPDHCSPAFLLFRSWVASGPLDVVGPAEVIEQCRMWLAPGSPVTFTSVAAGDHVELGDYAVRVLAASHGATGSSVLYDVASSSGRLLYATDTAALPGETVEAVRGAAFDHVLLEETFGDLTTHGTDHLDLRTFPEQVRRLRVAGAVTEHTDVVAVHLSHHNPPSEELNRRLAGWGARAVPDGTRLGSSVGTGRAASRGTVRTMVIGGARSGKSHEAERLLAAEPEVTYVATSYPAGDDPEWVARIHRHQARRPSHWQTLETTDLVPLLGEAGAPLLVDCLTLWLTRVMDTHDAWDDEVWAATGERGVEAAVQGLVTAWRNTSRRVVAVTNEVGQGVVPDTSTGRRFRDVLGQLNATLSAHTEDVRLCLAGRVVRL